jgi:hypothetical protein
MPVTVVRYTAKPDRADENQRYVEQVFAALADSRPEGLTYATYRLADGVSFVHVAEVTGDGNPLLDVPAFKEFLADLPDRLVDGPHPSPATLIGSYR